MVTIDTAHGMEYSMNDKDMYKDMVEMFAEQREQNVAAIKETFEDRKSVV